MSEHHDIHFDITWIDGAREPQVQPDSRYPDGVDIDASHGRGRTCLVALPYPAIRCGHYNVHCQKCRLVVAVTTAGRPDDPRSVKLACLEELKR